MSGPGKQVVLQRRSTLSELRASWLAADKLFVTHYLSIEGHKAGAHSAVAVSQASRLHLNVRPRSRPARWEDAQAASVANRRRSSQSQDLFE